MSETTYGIELDGNRATLVEVLNRSAVSANTFTGATGQEALAQALASLPPKRKDLRLRLALVSTSTSMKRVDVTAAVATDRAAFEELAYKSLSSRDGTAVAGLFYNLEGLVGEALGQAAVVLAPSEPIDTSYRSLGDIDGEVVPPVFTLAGSDGLHLAVRHANADLTLVVGGHPVAHRPLRTGGLDNLASTLDPENGAVRLEALITQSGAPDALARSEFDRYLRSLAAEVRSTADRWTGLGEEIPETIHVFGAGARVRDLDDHLGDVGLSRTVDDAQVRAMAYIPMGAREAATGAFLAAVTHGTGMPQAAFPSPVVVERAAARAANRRRTRLLAGVAAALALPAVIYFGPYAAGQLSIASAENARTEAADRLAAVSSERATLDQIQTLSGAYQGYVATDPRWSQVLEVVYGTAAANNVQVSSVLTTLAEDGSISVTVSASSPDPAYAPMTNWINTLNTDFAAIGTTAPSFSSDPDDGSIFNVVFSLPLESALTERPVPGAQS